MIQILKHADNIVKNGKNVDKSLCTNLLAFEKFLQKLSIPWSIFTNKDTGQLQYRDFTGPEHKKIQQHINLDCLIPNHPKLESIKYLWDEFGKIISIMKDVHVEPHSVESQARTWGAKYALTFQAKDITPYMHVFMNHLPECIEMYHNINHFSQQAMEKLNDTVTILFFRSTNHRNTEAFTQVMKKQNRLSMLSDTYKENAVFKIHCGIMWSGRS